MHYSLANTKIACKIMIMLFNFNILNQSMNLNQIILSLSDLFKAKKIAFSHLQRIIQDLYQISTQIPFSQRLSILTTLIYFLHRALTNQQASVDKLKYQIFYGVLKNDEDKRKSDHTTKKNNNRNGKRKKVDITINQILEQAVSNGLAQLDNSTVPQITTKQGQNNNKKEAVLPPFGPQVIAELTQDINIQLKTPQKQAQMVEWQPSKLQNYQKWLALTQNGIIIDQQPKQVKTMKKHPQKQQIVIDDKIDITQGLSQTKMLQHLATKAKASRILQKQNRGFEHRIYNINPLLTHINKLTNLQKLKIKYSNQPKKGIKQQSIKSQSNYNEPDLNLYSVHQNKSQESTISIKESALNKTLRPKLTTLLKQSLVKTKKVTFRSICESITVQGESKGQIFYQLLHLNFKLQQKDVSSFGDILISI